MNKSEGYVVKDFFKQIRADYLLSSLMCIALGVVFIVWPDKTSDLIGTVLAVIMIVIGAVYLCSFFLHIATNGLSAAIGGIVLLLGVWILIQPSIVLTLIPIVIGVVLLSHGIRGFKESWDSKGYGYSSWGVGAVFSLISIVFGIVCIVDAFGVVKIAFVMIGIALVYNGLTNIWIAAHASHYERSYRKSQETIDVEFKDEE